MCRRRPVGFYPLPDPSWEGHEASLASVSLLLSSPFTLEDGDLFTLSMSLLTADDPRLFASQDVGFALLVQDNVVQAVLANLRPNGDHKAGDQAPPPEARFVGASAGVSVTEVTSGPTPLTLGSNEYGQPGMFGDCFGNCYTAVTSSYTPGAGTYQLLLGIYTLTGQLNDGAPGDPGRPSALTVNGVYITPVAEPFTLGLMGIGLLGLRVVRQRVRV